MEIWVWICYLGLGTLALARFTVRRWTAGRDRAYSAWNWVRRLGAARTRQQASRRVAGAIESELGDAPLTGRYDVHLPDSIWQWAKLDLHSFKHAVFTCLRAHGDGITPEEFRFTFRPGPGRRIGIALELTYAGGTQGPVSHHPARPSQSASPRSHSRYSSSPPTHPTPRAWGFLRFATDGRRVPLRTGDSILIGRAPGCDVVITDDPAVSERHALIEVHPEGPAIADLISTNGIEVNGHRVTKCRLSAGDEVLLGDSILLVANVEAALPKPTPRPRSVWKDSQTGPVADPLMAPVLGTRGPAAVRWLIDGSKREAAPLLVIGGPPRVRSTYIEHILGQVPQTSALLVLTSGSRYELRASGDIRRLAADLGPLPFNELPVHDLDRDDRTGLSAALREALGQVATIEGEAGSVRRRTLGTLPAFPAGASPTVELDRWVIDLFDHRLFRGVAPLGCLLDQRVVLDCGTKDQVASDAIASIVLATMNHVVSGMPDAGGVARGFLVIDELDRWGQFSSVSRLVAQGAARGMHCVLTTQHPDRLHRVGLPFEGMDIVCFRLAGGAAERAAAVFGWNPAVTAKIQRLPRQLAIVANGSTHPIEVDVSQSMGASAK